jgi:cardiolipin synthase
MNFELFAIIASILHLLGLVSAVKAIMESRTPQGAIAWALGLITFPYVAVPAYWVFGRSKFKGFVKLLREDRAEKGQMVSENKDIAVILLEYTELSPHAVAVQNAVRMPVWDYTTLTNWREKLFKNRQ